MRTETEINAEIGKLEEIKPKLRSRFSKFGNDHHRSFDIQIHVLGSLMGWGDINSMYPDADENSTAYETFEWKMGREVDYAPAESWDGLWEEKP